MTPPLRHSQNCLSSWSMWSVDHQPPPSPQKDHEELGHINQTERSNKDSTLNAYASLVEKPITCFGNAPTSLIKRKDNQRRQLVVIVEN